MTNFNKNVELIGLSGIRQFMQKAAEYDSTIGLTIGQPSFPTPEKIKLAAIDAISNDHTSYTANKGLLSLREAISKWVKKRYQLNYTPEEIIITVGASEALDITVRTLFSKGDEVLLPCPVYPGYEPLLTLQDVKVTYIDTRESNFKVTSELLEKSWTDNTKGIILTYPANPTGITYTKEELTALAQFFKDKDCFIIADEIYSEITYEDTHSSIASLPFMKEKTVVINGFSKSHAMTGFRIGYTLASEAITNQMIKVHQYNVSCATSISQYAALTGINDCQDDVEFMRLAYLERRNYVSKRLKEMHIPFVEPNGAFYIFPSIKEFNKTSYDFCIELLEKERLAITPGTAFSSLGEGYVRISYAYSLEELEDACNRLERFVSSLR